MRQLLLIIMLTVTGSSPFPSYNVPLGFWAVYSAFSKNGKASFAFITFCILSVILDIIFCAINSELYMNLVFSIYSY